MLQIRVILKVVSATVFSCIGICAPATGQISGTHDPAKAGSQLEFTQVDVFATRDWRSENIRILGFHLGMNRTEAIENARKNALDLIASTLADSTPCAVSACEVCKKEICVGLGLNFGTDDRVDAIHVMRPLRESPADVRNASITLSFKGKTCLFFKSYSNKLRLELLGPESRSDKNSSVRATKYVYPELGAEVYVSLSANKRVPESAAIYP